VHAGLGDRDEALRQVARAEALNPMSRDAWSSPIMQRNVLFVLARLGDTDAALDKLEFLLSFPNPGASPALLRIDPRADGLRDLPRFQAILARHGSSRS
jgi:hypothetical protein